jgi:glutaredoxin
MSKLQAIILEGCPYSIALVELLNNFNISFERVNVKQKDKEEYITPYISTFPQLYLIVHKEKILIGGYDKTSSIIDLIKNNDFETILAGLKIEYPNLNKKNKLRIIQKFM